MHPGTTRWLTEDELRPLLDLIPPQPAEAATEIGVDDDQRVEPGMQMLAVVFIAPMLGVVGLALWAALF
jgi:hypothetical protein